MKLEKRNLEKIEEEQEQEEKFLIANSAYRVTLNSKTVVLSRCLAASVKL